MKPYSKCLKDQVLHQINMPHYLPGKLKELFFVVAEVVNIVLALPLLPLAPIFALFGYWYEKKREKRRV